MYVIIGATGNTGNVVARRLLAQGRKVRAIGRSSDRLKSLATAGAEPYVCHVGEAEALTKAIAGAQALYAMIPPDMTSADFRAEQDRTSAALGAAIEKAGVKHVVSLSSIGADKPDKTGPVVGLHHLEQRLNRIDGLNVLHLRAAYFMENTLAQIGIIQSLGLTAGPLRPDLKIPMIATRDIGAAAAEALLRLEFKGQQTRELLGPRDFSMTEISALIGKAIGKPALAYSQLPDEQVRGALTQMGMSLNFANLLLEMSAALNSGYMRALEARSLRNTTPTSYEMFIVEEIIPRYSGKSVSA